MKKKNDEKKKYLQGRLLGYCPIFSKCESQYSNLYYDIELDRQGLGDRPGSVGACMVGHDTADWATVQATTGQGRP